jgi:class 3 adenylate cyclase/tetratricopeptide (TPR) repeat protein
VICQSCGTSNDPGRSFCRECGSRLAVTCAACGASNSPDDKFCGKCGTSLEATAAAADGFPAAAQTAAQPGSQPAGAERRVVSVLFADLVGFTSLAESRDSEVVRDFQARYFETASQIIERYGGTVEKYIGDAVMAVWGAPQAHEDDAERAVRAGLDLVDAVRELGDELGAELSARAGVLTGEAAVSVGAGAQNQGMVTGDLVNTASRLQSAAPAGGVLVGETTFQSASGAIAFEAAGEQVLKGKVSPVPAYRALRVVARRGGAGRSEQLEAPFVGRQAELRLLKDFHMATAAERRPRLVSIMGQGGIGKTRLVWEFQKYMDGLTEVVYWHQGRSPAYGEGITFWALAEMVRARIGVAEGEDALTVRARLAESLANWVPDESERRWLEPKLLQLLGVEGSAREQPDRESLFAAWRTFFERIAEQGVVVLVFEDLQWADGGLLDFIDHVLDWSRDRPIYLVTMARPELLDRRPDWGAGRRSFTSLVLEPLSEAEMSELLSGLVPGLPVKVAARILERAEGVPLYAVETVRMLLSEKRLERSDGAYAPVGDLSELSVPPSLHALVAARLDALEPAQRALLQAASVVGKTFSVDGLAQLSGLTVADVETQLRALVRRELLFLEADPRSPERGQYAFVQSVIREVAYSTLSKRDRRRLHIAAARYFETLDHEGIAGVLAEHYVAAYRAQPEGPEGEAVAAQARVALRGAADRASALGSYRQAAAYLEQALAVTPDTLEESALHSSIVDALVSAGRADLALPHSDLAVELLRPSGDRRRILDALVAAAQCRDLLDRLDEGLAMLDVAAAEYADLAGTAEHVRLVGEMARATLVFGNPARSDELVGQVLDAAQRLDLTRDTLHLLATRGAALAGTHRVMEAVTTLLGVVHLANSRGMADVELRGRTNLSYAAAAEDIELAYRTAREGYELSRHLGLRGFGFYLLSNAAESAVRLGDWDWVIAATGEALAHEEAELDIAALGHRLRVRGLRGEPVLDELEALAKRVGDRLEQQAPAGVEDLWSDVLLAHGELDEARRLANSSYSRAPAPDNPALLRAARVASWLGDVAGIRALLDQMGELSGRVVAAGRREIEACALAREGRPADAVAAFRDALDRWRELGARYELAVAELGMAFVLGAASPDAQRAADEAKTIFDSLGAEPYLRLLDRALSAPGTAAPDEKRAPKPIELERASS